MKFHLKNLLFLAAFLWIGMGGPAAHSGPIISQGGKTTIDDLPHFENFNSVEVPDIPEGWTTIIKSDNENAFVETSTMGDPVSEPNHIRAFNSTDADATLYLITPAVTQDLDQLRVRFFSYANIGGNNQIEVGTFDPDDESLTLLETFTLTNEHQEYIVEFDDYVGSDSKIAFRANPETSTRSIFIDDFVLEEIPTGPLAEVNPVEWDFGSNQYGFTWPPKTFTITNVGVGTLTIGPDDISLSGEDAGDFILNNLEATVDLDPFESTEVSVSFSAQSVGEKNAILDVDGFEVPLSGYAFDATITEFPHLEDFNDVEVPELPFGWSSYVESSNEAARVETTTLLDPISEPQQLRFLNMNDPDALLLFISPPIDADISQLRISFYAKSTSGTENAVEIGTFDPEADDPFTAIKSVTITTSHVQYEMDLNDYQGDDTRFAVRAVPEASVRPVYLDNLNIALIPEDAEVLVTPDSFEFEPTQYGESSDEKEFTITNIGGGILSIGPDDISITGDDASDFELNNLSEVIELGTNETAEIGVTFSPAEEGFKEAVLEVMDFEVSLSGNAYNPNITDLPHFEDFNDVDPPDLPFGWTTFIESTAARADIETSHLSEPNSPPHHVRFRNFEDPDAELILISPEIEFDISELRVSFYSKANIDGDHNIEVGTYDPASDTFTMLASFDISDTYAPFFFEFVDYDGDDEHIAFRAVQAQAHRFILLDDVLLDFAPEQAILEVSPDQYEFEPLQAGTTSAPQEFTLSNEGGDTLFIAPSDISITGQDPEDFLLTNLEDEVALLAGESAVISVTFSPEDTGNKEATLNVDDFEVPLSGEAFDATITDFPWSEDFSEVAEGEIPFGWIRDTENWGATMTDNAGGEAPEMRFHFVPILEDAIYLKSPWINTSDFDALLLSFSHMVNNYQNPGSYTLKIKTIVDDEEYLVHEWVDPDDMAAEEFSAQINAEDHGLGAENLRIAFVFDGATEDINHWFIDDILLREVPDYYTATFNVLEDSPEEDPIEGAIINIPGEESIYTDASGTASIELEEGEYLAEIIMVGYVNQEIEFTLDQDLSFTFLMEDEIADPTNLLVTTDEMEPGQALLSWDLEDILHEFRYDDGEVVNQLGYPLGDINSVMGAVHHYHGILHEMTWLLTEEGGPHNVVKLWVLGLDEDGLPDRNQVLYTAENVDNEDNEWNTYVFSEPVEAPDGFFIGVSFNGFLGLALDDGEGEPWEFVPGTHFGVYNIESTEYDFLEISEWDVEKNFLLRAYGDNLGTVDYGKYHAQQSGYGPEATTGNSQPQPFFAGEPETSSSKVNKAFTGFNVYLDDMDNPVAENITEQEYLFEELPEGEYTAGIQALYTTGESEISTIDFTIEEGFVNTFSLTFEVSDEEGEEIAGATVTLDGQEASPGEYFFGDLEPGTYDYSVSKDGYHEVSDQVTIVDEDIIVQITMIEDDVSVPGTSQAGLNIYPNPASSRLTIASAEAIQEIRMIDVLGQIVYAAEPETEHYELNVSAFKAGIYFIQVITEEGQTTERLQISR